MLALSWASAAGGGPTLNQHRANSRVCRANIHAAENTGICTNVGVMLRQRRRRWPTLYQYWMSKAP